jgi:predicted transposase/invertase (TIGR01784 family)
LAFREGDDYAGLLPVYAIWLIDGIVWQDAKKVHHAFRLSDAESGRILEGIEIHTLELARYNSRESDLSADDMLGCWLYWLRHAHEYEEAALLELFPQPALRRATVALVNIANKSEDKQMYDAREKAIRDRQWMLNAARREGKAEGEAKGKAEGKAEGEVKGKIEGKIELIRALQGILHEPESAEQDLRALSLDQLEALAGRLQETARSR